MKTPQVKPDWNTGIYIGNGVVAEPNKPEEGKQYLLIGGSDKPSIANGNTWAESEIKTGEK
tara:strand:+ start:144 stop:326 length:183 start_codon:yes stop_codon:yes gene_type:complete